MELKKNKPCPNCGGDHIEDGIAIALSNEVGNIGPHYKTRFLITGVCQMYCDLCLDCGEVVRMYIKDTTERNWIKTSGTVGSK